MADIFVFLLLQSERHQVHQRLDATRIRLQNLLIERGSALRLPGQCSATPLTERAW